MGAAELAGIPDQSLTGEKKPLMDADKRRYSGFDDAMSSISARISVHQRFFMQFVVVALCIAPVRAQLPTADLSRIVPRAVRAGESADITIVGQNLEDVTELRFTHPGITAQPVLLPADDLFPNPRPNGSRFTVSVADDVPPGIYETAAVGSFGLSTARPFVVAAADSNEVLSDGKNTTRENAQSAEIGSVITGEVPSRGIHWYRFRVSAGQRVLIRVYAERID